MLTQTLQPPVRGRTSSVPFMYFVGEGKNQSEKFKRLKVSGQLPSFSSSRLCYRDPSSKSALKLLPEYSQAPPWLCSVGTQMLRANSPWWAPAISSHQEWVALLLNELPLPNHKPGFLEEERPWLDQKGSCKTLTAISTS